MGLIGKVLGFGGAAREVGSAVTGVAEVFAGNRAAREAAEHAAFVATVGQHAAEFASVRDTGFDGFVNGLNRLPRPMLALGTLGLFVYAMAEPSGFALRMRGLAEVPEPLWWLLGAIVSFYFGARELHYRRAAHPTAILASPGAPEPEAPARPEPAADAVRARPPAETAPADRPTVAAARPVPPPIAARTPPEAAPAAAAGRGARRRSRLHRRAGGRAAEARLTPRGAAAGPATPGPGHADANCASCLAGA